MDSFRCDNLFSSDILFLCKGQLPYKFYRRRLSYELVNRIVSNFQADYRAFTPGSTAWRPFYEGSMERVVENAKRDLEALQKGGVDGVLMTNEFSGPFFTDTPNQYSVPCAAYSVKSAICSPSPMGWKPSLTARAAWKYAPLPALLSPDACLPAPGPVTPACNSAISPEPCACAGIGYGRSEIMLFYQRRGYYADGQPPTGPESQVPSQRLPRGMPGRIRPRTRQPA